MNTYLENDLILELLEERWRWRNRSSKCGIFWFLRYWWRSRYFF